MLSALSLLLCAAVVVLWSQEWLPLPLWVAARICFFLAGFLLMKLSWREARPELMTRIKLCPSWRDAGQVPGVPGAGLLM